MTEATHHTKPVPVTAVQWTGDNIKDIAAMIFDNGFGIRWERESHEYGAIKNVEVSFRGRGGDEWCWQELSRDDWIVFESGESDICNPDYFVEHYVTAGEQQ